MEPVDRTPSAASPSGRAFVVADAHGRHDLVEALLEQEGLLGDRNGTLTIQLGDLCNCVASSIGADQECLRRAPEWFDVYLVGNHEHPYFDEPAFSGYWRDPEILHLLRHYAARGLIRPCIEVGGVLVTHAGLTSRWGALCETAEEAAAWLTTEWGSRTNAFVFSAIGRDRGGWDRSGGVLWADWREPKRGAFKQLVGHTAGDSIRKRQKATCIDLGAGHNDRIAGAWIEEGAVRVVTYGLMEVAV
jgi:hypothetical protein